MWHGTPPQGLDAREAAVVGRLTEGPLRMADALRTRPELPALMRLVSRGLLMISGVTPSDASHVLGRLDAWDSHAAQKALALFAKRRNGRGDRIATGPESLAQALAHWLDDPQAVVSFEQACDEIHHRLRCNASVRAADAESGGRVPVTVKFRLGIDDDHLTFDSSGGVLDELFDQVESASTGSESGSF